MTTTTETPMNEATARHILGERNYEIMNQYYSIGRLCVAAALAANDSPRQAAAIRTIVARRQQEGRP